VIILEKTDEQGIAAMKSAGVQPVLLPGSRLCPRVVGFIRARGDDRGRPCGCTCDRFQPWFITDRFDAYDSLARLHTNEMSPPEAVTAATINAAHSP